MFHRLVNMLTSGRAPFERNSPVPPAADLAVQRGKDDIEALRAFLFGDDKPVTGDQIVRYR